MIPVGSVFLACVFVVNFFSIESRFPGLLDAGELLSVVSVTKDWVLVNKARVTRQIKEQDTNTDRQLEAD